MNTKNKIILILLVILTACAVGYCVYAVLNEEIEETDADKFRTEYMSLNEEANSNGVAYVSVSISETNTVEYISDEDLIELLESGTGIIYFGYATCPWCRTLVPVLTNVAEDLNEIIYYVDIYDMRSSFEVSDGVITQTKEGSETYYKILELLDSSLSEYVLTDDEGNSYETGEKRLYAPTVLAVKNGEVTGIHVGTIESQTSAYTTLSDEEIEELETIIKELIYSVRSNEVCSIENGC